MKLVIAEKPSVAMALASVLGARTRKDGYVEGNGYIVSWCVGHLVGLCDASEYDEKYKKWRYEDLHSSNFQILVIQNGKKTARIDSHQPVCLCPAKC